MERMLQKLAQQLDSIDEASLMTLWSKYATITERFEPTKYWEECALIFGLIQVKHWKNMLFNYMFARTSKPMPFSHGYGDFGFSLEPKQTDEKPKQKTCRVLTFTRDSSKKE